VFYFYGTVGCELIERPNVSMPKTYFAGRKQTTEFFHFSYDRTFISDISEIENGGMNCVISVLKK
jgi:hypothetical protein